MLSTCSCRIRLSDGANNDQHCHHLNVQSHQPVGILTTVLGLELKRTEFPLRPDVEAMRVISSEVRKGDVPAHGRSRDNPTINDVWCTRINYAYC